MKIREVLTINNLFNPERVFFEPSSLKYPLGQQLFEYFENREIEIKKLALQRVKASIPGKTENQKFARAKKTLVVATKKSMSLEVCKPSADFQFSLVTNCPGNCEYCYLHTTQAFKPYLRTYVNVEDIFNTIKRHISKNNENITTFEAASAGDPLAIEHITGSLAKTIEFFGSLERGRLRVVTKFDNVDSLLDLKHNGHTRFRISVNSKYVIDTFEHNTADFIQRIEAASKISNSGYPVGFIVAPIMVYDNWKEEYKELFKLLKEKVNVSASNEPVTFELIQHRFTTTAKDTILKRFPNTKLDMDESKRSLKWGKYGRFKYIYAKDTVKEIKEYITSSIKSNFPDSVIEYFT
ncbi:spore photoproduct lyase [Herbivorax sp. ANBcel31]|uniref:spore photoproduct lyase n=1 Tax=Herbivorax sp. ANBcel31 TaxID=3069754 RepID=UPI0027AEA4C6|nr:spore photoproduct lyase [Herbivorax sp. ANBcel31]MDQ2087326.1 spore photoproduct lyase [Herbivorax sp. ANBcel31]